MFERAYAMKSPVMEAEYAHDERSALGLYDCLIPTLREHRQLMIRPELYASKYMITDLKAKKSIMEIEEKNAVKRLQSVEEENSMLREKVFHLKRDIKGPLMWLNKIASATWNVDAHNILGKYETIRDEFDDYKLKSQKEIDDLWDKLSKCRKNLTESYEKLRKLSDEVTKPLIE